MKDSMETAPLGFKWSFLLRKTKPYRNIFKIRKAGLLSPYRNLWTLSYMKRRTVLHSHRFPTDSGISMIVMKKAETDFPAKNFFRGTPLILILPYMTQILIFSITWNLIPDSLFLAKSLHNVYNAGRSVTADFGRDGYEI